MFRPVLARDPVRKLADERQPVSVQPARLARVGANEVSPPDHVFVGENGSGKSTLLEAIAITAGLNHGNSHTRVHAQDILFATSTFPQEFSVVSQLRR